MVTFFPLSLSLNEAPVLVFGASPSAQEILLRLLENGAEITLVATLVCEEVQQLQVAYGRRLRLVKSSVADFLVNHNIGAYKLVFALSPKAEINMQVVAAAQMAAVPVSVPGSAVSSSFVVPATLKRGNVKISVSSDGLCPPLESSLISRIEELFVAEFDRYSIFLSEYKEKLEAASQLGASELSQLTRMLNASDELASALARKNFEEALRIVDSFIDELSADEASQAEVS